MKEIWGENWRHTKNRSQTKAIKFFFTFSCFAKEEIHSTSFVFFSSLYAFFSEKTWIAYESYIYTNHMVTALFLRATLLQFFCCVIYVHKHIFHCRAASYRVIRDIVFATIFFLLVCTIKCNIRHNLRGNKTFWIFYWIWSLNINMLEFVTCNIELSDSNGIFKICFWKKY